MSLDYFEKLEELFQESKLLTEHYNEHDDEFKEYIEDINNHVRLLLSDNLHDPTFVVKCMSYFPFLYESLPFKLRCNCEVSLMALVQDRKNLSLLPFELKESEAFKEILFFASPGFELNFDFIGKDEKLVGKLLEKISEDEYYFKYAPESLRKNLNFCCKAAEKNGMILNFLPLEFSKDEDLVRIALRQSGLSLKYAHAKFKADLSMVLIALKKYLNSIRYTHASLFREKELDFVWENPEWADFKQKELELLEEGYVKHLGSWIK